MPWLMHLSATQVSHVDHRCSVFLRQNFIL